MSEHALRASLRAKGVRPTRHRLALMKILARSQGPTTAEKIHGRMRGVDLVTVYRSLQTFVAVGLVSEVRFKDASVRYELSSKHHHHLVCIRCGEIDEVKGCDLRAAERKALTQSKKFASVEEHTLEFFGTCVTCAKR